LSSRSKKDSIKEPDLRQMVTSAAIKKAKMPLNYTHFLIQMQVYLFITSPLVDFIKSHIKNLFLLLLKRDMIWNGLFLITALNFWFLNKQN
jgi:hypothetical protein